MTMTELVLEGIGAAAGIAVGPAFCLEAPKLQPTGEILAAAAIAGVSEEFLTVWGQTVRELEELCRRTASRGGAEQADILTAQISMLQDPMWRESVIAKITAGKNTAWAVQATTEELARSFESMSDPYIRERAADIRDVGERLLRAVMKVPVASFGDLREPSIVVAANLSAADMAQLDFANVLGLVLETGSKTSHTAIIARGQGIAAIVGVNGISGKVGTGDEIAMDGSTGRLWVHPSETVLYALRSKSEQESLRQRQCAAETALPSQTADGHAVILAANVGGPADIAAALEQGAAEVGLFRTEFMFLDRRELPDVEEQFDAYRAVVEAMAGKPVIVRTLDVGGDKMLPGITQNKEENPFLGVRGIRLCLANPEVFRTQLTAILRASVYGRLKIMFPMVTAIDEIVEAKAILQEIEAALRAQKIAFDPEIPVGIMVEVPAAALQIRAFAPYVDFFSIGTNDLLQYTLAVDRGNPCLSALYDPCHPAFLSLVAQIIRDAHAAGRPVGMCGELAGDPRFTLFLLGVGLDEFSMSPTAIPGINYFLRRATLKDAQAHAVQVLGMERSEEIHAYLQQSEQTGT
ncbi:MAG TPA: phosphoenolpyruvate--protein phosphotransferase [Negativicutes bacterium]|nr:phosphoenolpyruvate--protein phosphotransferase [Negativicutes bacterium]